MLAGPLKDGQFSDGYTIKKHKSIFCKKPTGMKKQKPRVKQSGVERFSVVMEQNTAKVSLFYWIQSMTSMW